MSLPPNIPILLNGRPVEQITAFLFHAGSNDDPERLLANQGKSFQGSIVLGMGFTFDDSNPDATPIAEMHRLIAENPKNAEVIFPYIGGEEVNSSPTHSHHRYVIDFFDRSEEECWQNYPDLMEIVKKKVKPERDKQKRDALRVRWWQYAEKRPGLKQAIAPLERVLVTNSQASTYLSFIFYQPNVVFANSLNVFPLQKNSDFTVLQSRIHEVFARFFSSSLEDRLRYNPSDSFETFPFPELTPPAPLNKGGLREEQITSPIPPLNKGGLGGGQPLNKGGLGEVQPLNKQGLGGGNPLTRGGLRRSNSRRLANNIMNTEPT